MKWTAYTYMLLIVSVASILVKPHTSQGQELFLFEQGLQETLIEPDYSVDFIPDFTFDEVAERIRAMETDMPFTLNDRVYSFIDYFAVRNRDYVRMILEREVQYFPLFDEILRQHDMPEDIKYLAIIESALNPAARSRVGAMGLWQFMPATGRMYQLNISMDADDRRDPLAATEAAAKYLKSLYRMFDDWEVALAAYNCGPGNVRKAIRRSGGKKGFWEIYPYLPRETRGYVPQFQAMMYVMRHKELHGLVPDQPAYPIALTKIKPGMAVDFEQLAAVTGVKAEDIMQFNPAYPNGFLPESHQHKGIQLPAAAVAESQDWAALTETLQPDNERIMALRATYNPNVRLVAGGGPAYEVKYRVQAGDVLGKIAQRHGTTVANIKMWNNLQSNTIRVGQQLTLYTAAPTAASSGGALVAQSTVSITEKGGKKLYTVQPGDSLWLISKKVEGLSVEQIKKLNNLQNNQIKPGQQLIIG